MDLNELPPDFDYDFLEAEGYEANPLYCTQAIPSNPNGFESRLEENEQVFVATTTADAVSHQEAPESNQIDAEIEVEIVDADQDINEEEVWSTPPVPYIGQSFATKQEAKEYYNQYAKRIGFSIRTSTSRLTVVTREQRKVVFVCNKEGYGRKVKEQEAPVETDNEKSDEQESEPESNEEGQEKKKKLDGGKKRKREKMQHTNCKARMVVKQIGPRWQVIHFAPDHNHDLVLKPSLKKFLRSHKGIPKAEKEFIVMLHGSNLSTGRIMQLMSEFYGSAQIVPYVAKDVRNFRSTLRRVEKYKDMQETMDYFQELEQEDPEFFYKVKLDRENRVESLFWVDSTARHAYIESYNDCVSFDATYMTNMYDMPFAPFICINRHGQSFQVGCAFLRDEKTPSYVWLFETFLLAMKGKSPLNIITDQDVAMRNAIVQVFPEANHRNCRWHIMDKFSGTIGPILEDDNELEEDFKECMNHTVTPAEFESKWAVMVGKFGLHDNVHFQRLYDIRHSFVPAYYMHCFFPFLQSTQRSEGFNAVLKRYVNPNMSILHFVRQYQKIQEKCLVAQDGQDFSTDEKERRRWSRYPIERHASTVYTKNLFYKFSKEFEKTAEYDATPEGQFQYWLIPNNIFVYGYGKRVYLVTAVQEEESYYCECSKFDRDGVLCCHIMKIMTRLGVKTIPERYILKRWTQEAISENENLNAETNYTPEGGLVARGMPLNNKRTLWFTNLSTAFASLAVDGSVSNETYTVVQSRITMMRAEIDEIKKRKKRIRQKKGIVVSCPGPNDSTELTIVNNTSVQPIEELNGDGNAPSSIGIQHAITATTSAGYDGIAVDVPATSTIVLPTVIGNPPRSKCKGRKKEKRLKKGMNAEAKRKNKCSICKATDHNAARCPQKKKENA